MSKQKKNSLPALNEAYKSGLNQASILIPAHEYYQAIGAVTKKTYKDYDQGYAAIRSRESIDPSFFDQDQALNRLVQPTDPMDRYRKAMLYYRIEPMIKRPIELLAQFADDGLKFVELKEKTKDFFESWASDIGWEQVIHKWFLEYFKVGVVNNRRVLINYTPSVKRALKDGKNVLTVDAETKKRWTKSQIPAGYTTLHPLLVEVVSAHGIGMDLLKFKPPQNYFSEIKKTKSKLPDDFNSQMNKSEIILDPRLTFRICREKPDYESYPSPMSESAFRAVFMKHAIQSVDLHTINGMLTQIVKITIGDKDFPAKPSHLNKLAAVFKKDTRTPFLFGNHTLKIEVIDLNTARSLSEDKYEHWNKEIRGAFGITSGLLGGSSGGMSGSFIDIEGFLANIGQARTDIAKAFNDELEFLAEQFQFDSAPRISFDTSILRDKNRRAQVIANLISLGIVSYKSGLEDLGFAYDTEKDRRTLEVDLQKTGIFGKPPGIGFGPGQGGPPDDPKGVNGRPGNDPRRQNPEPGEPRGPRGLGPKKGSRASLEEQEVIGCVWDSEADEDFDKAISLIEATGMIVPTEEEIISMAKLTESQTKRIRKCVDDILPSLTKQYSDKKHEDIKALAFGICSKRIKGA